jgi:hypothetical protein
MLTFSCRKYFFLDSVFFCFNSLPLVYLSLPWDGKIMKKTTVIIVSLLGLLVWTGLAAADLASGLVAYYPFNGNAQDESGNNRDALLIDGAILTSDRFGQANRAYYFDGVDDSIELPHPGYLANGSISLWAYLYKLENPPFFDIAKNRLHGHYSGMAIGHSNFMASYYRVTFDIYTDHTNYLDYQFTLNKQQW